MIIRNATIEDKSIILDANDRVNKISGLTSKSLLEENFEKDFFGDNPKAHALIIEKDGKTIGMCIYSYTYWANKGRGVYLSNIYVDAEYRRNGVLKAVLEYLRSISDVNFVTMLVGNENKLMQDTLIHYGAEDIDMKTFYLK